MATKNGIYNSTNGYYPKQIKTNYLYCCTVHFEDSLSITHQQMHKLYIIY
jgi:hypothetical protein